MTCTAHNSLANYYRLNFGLMQFHGYSLAEVENMVPWERQIYVSMLLDHIEKNKD